jgi:DNA polymerase-3 subunit alpha
LPAFPVPQGQTTEAYLESESQRGLQQFLDRKFAKDAVPNDKRDVVAAPYRSRLTHELEVICDMGFAGYFLIVADFIRWAKEQRIPVGPGRGSGAGSLVAYVLSITDVDPLEHDLLFERFFAWMAATASSSTSRTCMGGIAYRRSSLTERWPPKR